MTHAQNTSTASSTDAPNYQTRFTSSLFYEGSGTEQWIFVCLAVLVYLCVAFWGETYDDVFLAYQYARNIEAGKGFVFNAGEHFLGTPAPLFVLLLVALHALLPNLTLPQIGTLLSSTGLSILAYSLFAIGRIGNHSRICCAVISLLAVFNPLSILVLGGESPIYLALITSAILSLFRGQHGISGFLVGLALMNRTEALIPLVVIAFWLAYTTRSLPVRFLVSAFCTSLPWLAFAFWEFGSPLSNSFVAKLSQVSSGRKPFPLGLARWFQTVIFGQYPLLLLSLMPACAGLISLFKSRTPYMIVALWGLAQTVVYCCLPIPFYHWYAAHIGVLAAIVIGYGACAAPSLLQLTRASSMYQTGFRSCIVLCSVVTAVTLGISTRKFDLRWPHNQANELYTKTGEWFAANSETNARIAYLEIGQIAFYSERYIIDTLGLVSPGVAARVAMRDWIWSFRHYKPDYIIYNELFTTWPDYAAILREPWFVTGFTETTRISTEAYPVPLIIYKRLPGAQIPDPK